MPLFDLQTLFNRDYPEARECFLKNAEAVHADLRSHSISSRGAQGEELTIDIATVGAKNPSKVILLTSAIHGAEGLLGSAIQVAWLKHLKTNPQSLNNIAVVLVHAINPYGFSWVRRFNENNVDLNRNFKLPQAEFLGSPPQLKKIAWLQQPVSPNNKFFFIELYMAWTILCYGFSAIRHCVIQGQYDYPQGLFWGGQTHEESTLILQNNIDAWTQHAPFVLHLDLHTGLGKYGHCDLLTFEGTNVQRTIWLQSKFQSEVSTFGTGLTRGGKPGGIMRDWLAYHFDAQKKFYTYLTLEFGTYSVLEVFKALYQENRFHQHPGRENELAKKRLLEVFCPSDPAWREKCVADGLAIISKALHATQEQ